MHSLKKAFMALSLFLTLFMLQNTAHADSLTDNSFQQGYHYNIPQGFMNDIQSIFQDQQGYYHIYYLANLAYRHSGDGTEWYQTKTRDFVHFEDAGIAIPKFNGSWSAVATGSLYENSDGFFKDLPKNAIMSYFTSYVSGIQKQFVAYSIDGGQHFQPYCDYPVMSAADDQTNFRDPYIFYDHENRRLIMYLAEGDKIGAYASDDGKHFTYIGATLLNAASLAGKDLGLVECPNMKNLYDPATQETKTVLFFSANGYNHDQSTGSYYMIGHLNQQGVFVAEQLPQRIDDGTDFYAANYVQASRSQIISLAWLGNWDYSAAHISSGQYRCCKLGSASLAHSLTLAGKRGHYRLENRLLEPFDRFSNNIQGRQSPFTSSRKDGYFQLLNLDRWSQENIYLQFANVHEGNNLDGHIRINFKQKDSWVRLDYDTENGRYMVSRHTSCLKDAAANQAYSKPHVQQSGLGPRNYLKLHIYEDQNSLEFYFEDSKKSYTMLKYSTDGQTHLQVETSGNNNLYYAMNKVEGN